MIGLAHIDVETCSEKAVADRRPESIDGLAGWPEAVEVTRGAVHDFVSDQRAPSGQGEPVGFGEREDSDATRCWSSDSDMNEMFSNPTVPRLMHGRR